MVIVIGFACSVLLKCSDRSVASELSYCYYYLVRFYELTYHKACVHSKLRELSCTALAYLRVCIVSWS